MHPDTAHFYDGDARARADRRGAAAAGPCGGRAGGRSCRATATSPRRSTACSRRSSRRGRSRDGDIDRRVAGDRDARARARRTSSWSTATSIILGDLLSPVFTPWFDYGYSNDPVAEFLGVAGPRRGAGAVRAGACPATGGCSRTCPRSSPSTARGSRPGWTRPSRRSATARTAAHTRSPRRVFGDLDPIAMVWRLTEIAAYLRHLRLTGASSATRRDGLSLRRRLTKPNGCLILAVVNAATHIYRFPRVTEIVTAPSAPSADPASRR